MAIRTAARLRRSSVTSPIGRMLLAVDGADRLVALDFGDDAVRTATLLRRHGGCELVDDVDPGGHAARLSAYFAGELGALDGLTVAAGGTAFQERVWAALRAIPVGTTTTYGAIAARIGHPTASRAVGMANRTNPVAIVVPCHRVVGADHTLTGYAGGLDRKRWLLHHEGASGTLL